MEHATGCGEGDLQPSSPDVDGETSLVFGGKICTWNLETRVPEGLVQLVRVSAQTLQIAGPIPPSEPEDPLDLTRSTLSFDETNVVLGARQGSTPTGQFQVPSDFAEDE